MSSNRTEERALAVAWRGLSGIGAGLLLVSVWLVAADRAAGAESGFHSATITRVAVDPAGRLLATASEDKTVRVWELPTGRLLRTMAPPGGTGPRGEVYALAISPDGKTIAFGGFTGQKNPRTEDGRVRFDYEIYLHDLRSGRRLTTLDVPALIDHLSFSHSGDYLLASASEMPVLRFEEINYPVHALTIFRTRDHRRLADVPAYFAAIADYDRPGRLAVIGKPGGAFVAELLDRDLDTLASRNFPGSPAAVRFSPDGSMFAVSTLFPGVHVYSSRDLSVLYSPDLRGAAEADATVAASDTRRGSTIAWSRDGRFLYYAAAGTCRLQRCAIRKWSDGGRGGHVDLIVAQHRVTHLVPLPGGGIAFATAGPAFGAVNANDVRILYRDQSGVSRTPVVLARQDAGAKGGANDDRAPATPSPGSRLSNADQQRLAELHRIVAAALDQRRPGDALPLAREALQLAEFRMPPDDPAFIQPLRDVGRAYHQTGRYRAVVGGPSTGVEEYRKARAALERALRLLEAHKGPRHPEVADLLEELADLHAALYDFDDAVDLKRRILAILKSRAGDRRVAQIENDIELLRVENLVRRPYTPKLGEALPLALAQLRRAESQLGPSHVNVARGRANLATIYQKSRVGLRATALQLHEQALALHVRVQGADHWETVAQAAGMATLYSEGREFAKAGRLYEAVEAATAKALGRDHPAMLELLTERGWVLEGLGRYDEAAALFARILAFWDDRLARDAAGDPVREVRRSLERLADMHAVMGEPEKADLLYGRVLGLKDWGTAPMQPFMVARVLGKRATQQRLQGDVGSARASLGQALALIEKDISPPDRQGVHVADSIAREAYCELAATALASNDTATARGYLERAIAIDDHLVQFWLRPKPAGELLDSVQERATISFSHHLLALTARHYGSDAEAVARAFDVLLNRKGIALDLQSQTMGLRGRLDEKTQTKLAELARVRGELATLTMARPAAMMNAEYAQKITLLFERAVTLETALTRDEVVVRPVKASDVAARLARDTVLVEFVRIDDPGRHREPEEEARYLAFTLTGSGRLSLVDLGAARTIDELVADLQSALRGPGQPALLVNLLRALHSRLWLPLEGMVREASQVLVSPDSELHRVPFVALIDAQARSLIERHRFVYVGSGRDLVSTRPGGASPARDLALVANPDFAGTRFDPLPGTAREAQMIPRLVARDKGQTILVGRAATKSAVKQIRSPRILHIATHGVFLERDTLGVEGRGYEHSLLRSGLALARAHAGDDGMLTALEVSDMDLSGTQLVVLSACDTGAGSVTRGQGILGLRRAFALAGARGVLVALWPVDDAVTASLMANFYRHLATLSPAEALHRAQRESLERLRASNGFAHPRLWAPFLLESPTAFAHMPRD